MKENRNEIIIFENQNVKLEVNVKDKTVWLTQKQMAELFDKDRKTITRHIQNIYKDEELDENSVCSFFEHTAEDGKKYKVQYYNLDMIISVGYRVNSKRGIAFRRWATKILKDYMLQGYAVNQKRLEYLEKTVKLIDIANRIDDRLENDDAKEILKIKEDENSGVKWVPIEDVKKVSTEKWIVENVYEKLNEKLKSQLKFVLN